MSWDAEVKELGEVCSFQRGLTYAKGDEVDRSENVVLRANNISMATNALDFTELKYIKDSIAIPENKLVRRDTLMICTASGSKSHLGKVAYVDDDYGYAFGGFMGLLVPEREVRGRYLYYAMLSDEYKEFIDGLSDGVNINNLKWDDLKSFTLPIPLLPEQQRIVGKLDAAFAALAEAQAHVERNRANAQELFESYLNGVFEGKGDGWNKTTLDEICEFENGDRGTNYPHRREYVPSGIPWINTGHIEPDGTLSLERMNYITPEKFKTLRSGKIKAGDLVYCLRGATLGKTAIVDPLTTGAVASSLVIIRPGKTVLSRYLYYFLTSPGGQRMIKLYDNGAAQPNLGAKSVARYIIALPPLAEQDRIVKSLDALARHSQQLETTYQQKLSDLAGLKKAVLGAAFRGEL